MSSPSAADDRLIANASALEGLDRAHYEHLTRWPGPGHAGEPAWQRREDELEAESRRLLADRQALMAEFSAGPDMAALLPESGKSSGQ